MVGEPGRIRMTVRGTILWSDELIGCRVNKFKKGERTSEKIKCMIIVAISIGEKRGRSASYHGLLTADCLTLRF